MEDECVEALGRPISSLKVADLRNELTKRALIKTGNKKELIDRLRSAIVRSYTIEPAKVETNCQATFTLKRRVLDLAESSASNKGEKKRKWSDESENGQNIECVSNAALTEGISSQKIQELIDLQPPDIEENPASIKGEKKRKWSDKSENSQNSESASTAPLTGGISSQKIQELIDLQQPDIEENSVPIKGEKKRKWSSKPENNQNNEFVSNAALSGGISSQKIKELIDLHQADTVENSASNKGENEQLSEKSENSESMPNAAPIEGLSSINNSQPQELDDLYRKTRCKPPLFWLPLTEEQAELKKKERLEREARNQSHKIAASSRRSPQKRRSPPNRQSSSRHRSPARRSSPPRHRPDRRESPRRRSPATRKSPIRRRSPPRRSPIRRSPIRRSPIRRSPIRRSPGLLPRRSPGPLRRSPGPLRRSPGPLRRSPGPIRRSPGISRRSPGPIRRHSPGPIRRVSPMLGKRSPAPIRRSPIRRSPGQMRRSPNIRRRSPGPIRRSPGPTRRSPLIMRRSPGLMRRSPNFMRRSPMLTRRSPAPIRGGSPRRSRSPRRRSPIRRRTPSRLLSPPRDPEYPSEPRRIQRPDRLR